MFRRSVGDMPRPLYKICRKLWFVWWIGKDKRRGVDFYAPVDNEGTPEALAGHIRYESTGFLFDRALKEFLRRQNHANDRILDVGCGKGRMLEVFHTFGFLKADGLEYSSELSKIARENMKKLGLPCEVFTGDAAEFDGYDTYNWFYLYNPFAQNIMLRFIGKLKESLRRNPRKITILYTYPRCESAFAEAGFHMGWAGAEKYKVRLITNEGMPEAAAE